PDLTTGYDGLSHGLGPRRHDRARSRGARRRRRPPDRGRRRARDRRARAVHVGTRWRRDPAGDVREARAPAAPRARGLAPHVGLLRRRARGPTRPRGVQLPDGPRDAPLQGADPRRAGPPDPRRGRGPRGRRSRVRARPRRGLRHAARRAPALRPRAPGPRRGRPYRVAVPRLAGCPGGVPGGRRRARVRGVDPAAPDAHPAGLQRRRPGPLPRHGRRKGEGGQGRPRRARDTSGRDGAAGRRRARLAPRPRRRGAAPPGRARVARVAADELRVRTRAAIGEFARIQPPSEAVWERFAGALSYVAGDPADTSLYPRLERALKDAEATRSGPANRLFYCATPPSLYDDITANLGASGLARPAAG